MNACPPLGLGGMSQNQAGLGTSEINYLNLESERHVVLADLWDSAHMVQRKAIKIIYDMPVPTLLLQPLPLSHFFTVSLTPCTSTLTSFLWFSKLAMHLKSFPRQLLMFEIFFPSCLTI